MYIGNAMLLILNLPLIGIWVRVLKTPYAILFPMILLFCLVGVYTVHGGDLLGQDAHGLKDPNSVMEIISKKRKPHGPPNVPGLAVNWATT